MIELYNLSKKYSGSNKFALNQTSISIKPGMITGFIGPNGAGKSTTLNLINGSNNPTTGDVLLNGFSITKDSINAKRQLAFVSDNPDLFLKLTGYQYLNFIANIFNVDPSLIDSKIKELAHEYLINKEIDQLIDSYSHGMRQKIMIMGALIHEPSILVLDEPLTGLDPQASRILKNSLLKHAQKGYTVLFSTHVLEVAEKLCDEIIIINNGHIKYQGTLEELKKLYHQLDNLEELFFEVVKDND
ncbi:MAG: ABC transporter ATP-binding protein [Bacilli bacterium]